MVSKGFSLNLSESTKKDACVRILLAGIFIALIILVIIFAVYAFKSGDAPEDEDGCGVPIMDEYGLTNWTKGADHIVYSCFPGFFMDLEEKEEKPNLLSSTCQDKIWNPPPPSCNYLPMMLNCSIDQKGLKGQMIMWQNSTEDPTAVSILIDYEDAAERALATNNRHLTMTYNMSKIHCKAENANFTSDELPEAPENSTTILHVNFESNKMVAYRSMELYLNFIFINETHVPYTISLQQGNETLFKSSPKVEGRDLFEGSDLSDAILGYN